MSVYSPMLGTLWRTLESYGVDPAQAIKEQHYRPGQEPPRSDRISFADYDATLDRAAALIDDPALGLRSALFMHPSHLGALGHAWLSSPTLREALRMAARFSRMSNESVETRIEELPDRILLSYRMLRRSRRSQQLEDAHLAALLVLCRLNFGPSLQPIEVSFRHPQPDDPTPWIEFFGKTVRFNQPELRLGIATKDADTPLTGFNRELFEVHEAVLGRQMLQLDRSDIVNLSRLRIMEGLPSGRVTEEHLAHALNISKRTLHRKLREHEETFRSLLIEVRRDLAERYIGNMDYSITDIAFLLGYNDTSAFSRAFRNWFGFSPTEARERQKAA